MMHTPRFLGGLYGITPDSTDLDHLLVQIEQACQGGMHVLQWRQKTLDLTLSKQYATKAFALCRRYGCQFFMNDHLDLALEIGTDGIHVGKDDLSIEQVKQRMQQAKHPLLIGVSCYNDLNLAKQAIAQGVDYIAFGALFHSQVKPHAVAASLDLFGQAHTLIQASAFPWTATVGIGGINQDNAAQVVQAGANSIALITHLFQVSNIKETASFYSSLFNES